MTISRIRTAAPLLALTIVLGLGACGTDTEEPAAPTTSDSADDEPTTTEDSAPPSDADESTDDGATTEEPSVTPTDPADPTDGDALPTGDVPEDVINSDMVQSAIADLAERESVEADQVVVAGHRAVTWSDGSIGCPKPGMMYTQALVPGQQLILEVDGELFSYHSADRGAESGKFNFCADPKPPAETGGAGQTM